MAIIIPPESGFHLPPNMYLATYDVTERSLYNLRELHLIDYPRYLVIAVVKADDVMPPLLQLSSVHTMLGKMAAHKL